MAVRKNTRLETLKRRAVEKWKASGLTQAEFCRREGIPEWKFSNWKCSLQRTDEARAKPNRKQAKGTGGRGVEFAAIGELGNSSHKHQASGWSKEPFVPLVVPGLRAPHGQVAGETDSTVTVQIFFSRPAVQVVLSGTRSETLRDLLAALMEFSA